MRSRKILWHYTDAQGLFGILAGSALRFGDIRFLNDRTERTYPSQIVQAVVREEASGDDQRGEFARRVQQFLDPGILPTRTYISCFSQKHDSLSQWQRYGSNGAGYCVGFDTQRLDKKLAQWCTRVQMVYNPTRQRQLIREQLREDTRLWLLLQRQDPEMAQRVGLDMPARNCADRLEALSVCLKNPFFADEREWRYVRIVQELFQDEASARLVEFAARDFYIRPFTSLPPPSHATTTLPIVSIICGPRLDYAYASESLWHFLDRRGYPPLAIRASALASVWR